MDVEKQKALEQWVDELFAESDRRAFEIMHKIAALAIEQTANGLLQ